VVDLTGTNALLSKELAQTNTQPIAALNLLILDHPTTTQQGTHLPSTANTTAGLADTALIFTPAPNARWPIPQKTNKLSKPDHMLEQKVT
jgi:hypothetical protein